MEHLKIKVIGVLKEREESANANGNANGNSNANNSAAIRQFPKLTALDLAGILNCRRRLEWTKEWLKKNQTQFMTKENLQKEIQFRSNETYPLNCFFDITEKQFRYLVTKLAPVISGYEPHRKKKSFSAEERLAITLKYLATGEVHSCRNYCFLASKPVILKMIADICLNIYDLLKDQFICTPKTEEQWQTNAKDVQLKSKLPNCIGNLTMKQIKFYTNPRNKEINDSFSTNPPLIFTAIVDSSNNFVFVDVEKTTANSAEQIYENSKIKQLIETEQFALPATALAATPDNVASSYYFVGNGALPLKSYLMNTLYYVPTSKDESYTFSRLYSPEFYYCIGMDDLNQNSKCALQMLSNIFPIFSQPLRIDEANARKITLGCVALYNFLRKTDKSFYQHSERIYCDIDDIIEDDDCVLIHNEEERREIEENTPNVTTYNCFHYLQKQKGETVAGLTKRAWLMQYLMLAEKQEQQQKQQLEQQPQQQLEQQNQEQRN